jgi:hypothetical protein
MDVTFASKKFKDDVEIPMTARVMAAIERSIPGGAILASKESIAFKEAKRLIDISGDLTDRLTPVDPKALREAITPDMGPKEAVDIIQGELAKKESQLPLLSGKRMVEYTVPRVAKTVAEFAILKGLGIPVQSKALAASSPATARVLQTAQLLGVHTAVTDIKGWKDDPFEKVHSVMKSAGLGAVIGPVREYIQSPISRMGVITGGLAAQTFVSSKLSGADTDESFRQAFHTIETLLALEISGFIGKKANLRKSYRMAEDSLVKSYQESYPEMTKTDAKLHASAMINGIKQDGIYKISNRLIKPLVQLEKQGKLLPEEVKQLAMFRNRSKKVFEGTQKVVSATEKFFLDKTISRYPGKVKDQATLEDIGTKIATDLGIDPNKIVWQARTVKEVTFLFHDRNPDNTYKGKQILGFITSPSGKTGEPGNIRNIIVGVDQSNINVKKTIIHELVHAFTPSIVTKNGQWVAHHKEFKRRVSEHEKRLTTKTRLEVTKAEKIASEQYRARLDDAEYITRRFKSLGLSTDEQAALIYEATGTIHKGSLIDPKITGEQLGKIRKNVDRFKSAQNVLTMETALGLSAKEALNTRKAAGQNLDTYARALEGRNNVPLSKDSYLRKQQLNILGLNAKAMARRESGWNWFKGDEKLSFLNPRNWASSRYFFDYLSRVTGRPLLERKDYLEQSSKEGNMMWSDLGESLRKATKLSENQILKIPDTEKANLANYLFYGKAIQFNNLSANGKKIAGAIQGALNEGGPVANQIRELMWKKLNSASARVEDKISRESLKKKPNKQKIGGWKKQRNRHKPSDVKDEDVNRIIAEGREAKANGKFSDWIATQKWGTREYYYMGEHEWNDFKTDTLEMLKAPSLDIYEKNLKKANIEFGALKARKEGAKPDILTHPYIKTKRHAHRAYTLNAMYDNFEKFNNSVMGVEHLLTPQDKAAVEMYRNAVLGRQTDIGAANRLFMRVNEAWWDGYSKQPTRVLYFGYRNLFQNLALLPGQISPIQFTKSALKLVKQGGPSPQAMKDYKTWYDATINQKRQMWETMSMVEHPEALKTRGAHRLFNIGREIIPLTDSINRQMLWWPLHQLATDNIESYRQGKTTSKQLMKNLRLHSVSTGQKDRLLNLLTEKNYGEFVKWYTTDKVRNAHFVYDKFGRSILELNQTNRSYIGLATWPRGAGEAYWHQVVKPITTGIATKNPAQAYEGIKNLTGMAVGLYLAREGMRYSFGTKGASFGQEPYGIVGAISYNPMTPGMGWTGETLGLGLKALNDTYDMLANSEEMRRKGKTPQDVFDSWLTSTSRQVEVFFPLTDVAKEAFDKMNDKDGTRFYHILKELVTDYDIKRDKDLKDNRQGLVDKWVTGAFGTSKE